jgi:hypothetical protein
VLLVFSGEQHGFRKSENIQRALDGEFYFFGRVLGFTPADTITGVGIVAQPSYHLTIQYFSSRKINRSLVSHMEKLLVAQVERLLWSRQ